MTNKTAPVCFVLMPSGNHGKYAGEIPEADFIYNQIIKPSVLEALGPNVIVHREEDSIKAGAVTSSIIKHLATCDIAIVDITGRNPNVFLELGIRYSLRKNITILMRRPNTIVPFDVNELRSMLYNPSCLRKQKEI